MVINCLNNILSILIQDGAKVDFQLFVWKIMFPRLTSVNLLLPYPVFSQHSHVRVLESLWRQMLPHFHDYQPKTPEG